jgi:SAM-dependent methyltransferase
MKEINNCEVCDSKDLTMVLDLGLHPLCDDLIEIGSSKQCHEYPVEILFCSTCKTAHQRFQVPKKELFGENYHYRARMTGSVLKGMEDLVESCVQKIGNLENKLILDIGCNDGSLLDFFKKKGCETIGVEPTGAAFDSKHYTYNKFFDDETVELILEKFGKPDIITFTNVFAHIEDLNGLLNNLKKLLKPNTYVVIENHYLGAVLNYGQFDTFYHEHPRTYSFDSFKFIAKKLNLNLIDCEFVSRYGGNIRAFLSSDNAIDFLGINEGDFINKFGDMNVEILNWKFKTQLKIKKLVEEFGPIRAKAFPGRAAILIKILGLTEKSISAVYEIKGSIKVNNYVPGTRIPILPEADLYYLNNNNVPILNLAWHLPKEVRENLKKNGYNGVVIDIKDFKLN